MNPIGLQQASVAMRHACNGIEQGLKPAPLAYDEHVRITLAHFAAHKYHRPRTVAGCRFCAWREAQEQPVHANQLLAVQNK